MDNFKSKVYNVVKRIPFGEVCTYKWVAKKSGRPRAYRAVGQILKNNPHPFIVPCHRVIKSDGTLGGYSLGQELKQKLIELEKMLSLKA